MNQFQTQIQTNNINLTFKRLSMFTTMLFTTKQNKYMTYSNLKLANIKVAVEQEVKMVIANFSQQNNDNSTIFARKAKEVAIWNLATQILRGNNIFTQLQFAIYEIVALIIQENYIDWNILTMADQKSRQKYQFLTTLRNCSLIKIVSNPKLCQSDKFSFTRLLLSNNVAVKKTVPKININCGLNDIDETASLKSESTSKRSFASSSNVSYSNGSSERYISPIPSEKSSNSCNFDMTAQENYKNFQISEVSAERFYISADCKKLLPKYVPDSIKLQIKNLLKFYWNSNLGRNYSTSNKKLNLEQQIKKLVEQMCVKGLHQAYSFAKSQNLIEYTNNSAVFSFKMFDYTLQISLNFDNIRQEFTLQKIDDIKVLNLQKNFNKSHSVFSNNQSFFNNNFDFDKFCFKPNNFGNPRFIDSVEYNFFHDCCVSRKNSNSSCDIIPFYYYNPTKNTYSNQVDYIIIYHGIDYNTNFVQKRAILATQDSKNQVTFKQMYNLNKNNRLAKTFTSLFSAASLALFNQKV